MYEIWPAHKPKGPRLQPISLDEWLRTLPPDESYKTEWKGASRFHILADEEDPETGKPASAHGPRKALIAAPAAPATPVQPLPGPVEFRYQPEAAVQFALPNGATRTAVVLLPAFRHSAGKLTVWPKVKA